MGDCVMLQAGQYVVSNAEYGEIITRTQRNKADANSGELKTGERRTEGGSRR